MKPRGCDYRIGNLRFTGFLPSMMATRCSSREPVLGWLAISMAHSRDLVENDAGTWTRQIDATRRMYAELPGLAPSLLCLSVGFPFLLFSPRLLCSNPRLPSLRLHFCQSTFLDASDIAFLLARLRNIWSVFRSRHSPNEGSFRFLK